MSREPLPIRVYALLLHTYPRRFRDEYGPDMVLLVRDQLRDEPAPRVLARSAVDLAITIPTQHLEAHMGTPSRLVPLLYLVVAAAGLALVVLGGTQRESLVIGLLLAAGAGVIGIAAWRQTSHVHTATSLTSEWWKLLLTGPILIAGVILAAGVGIEAWFLGIAAVLTALGCIALGAALGIAHLIKTHVHSAPA